ncbi:MAG TPA: MFS transporter [Phycisphaerae bacterium]|nr:MFS transporter [Phycisphaerae bacterium]
MDQGTSATTQAAAQDNKPFTARTLDLHLWGSSGIAQYFMWKEFALANFVFIQVFGLKPAIVGMIFMAPRLLDAFFDPLMGHLSDISNTRWGRRRPFMFVTSIVGAGLLLALYWVQPDWPDWAHLAYLGTVLTLYYYIWGTYEMNRRAMGYELSDDYSVRSKIQAIGTWWFTLPSLIGSSAYFFIVKLSEGSAWEPSLLGYTFFSIPLPDVGTKVDAVRYVAMICAGIILVFGLGPTLLIKERKWVVTRQGKHAGLFRCLLEAIKNRPFVMVLLLRLAETLGASLYTAVGIFINIHYVCGGDEKRQQAVMQIGGAVLGFLVASIVWPLAAPVTKLIGKRWGLILGYGASLLSACLLPLIVRPDWEWVLLAHTLVFLIPFSMQKVFLESVMPDICDYDELKSGERREGLYTSVTTFINQLEISLCSLIAGCMMQRAGFDSKAVSQGVAPSTEVLHRLMWYGMTPLIFFSLVAFVITWFMPLTPKVMAEIHAELEKRRAAARANQKEATDSQ